MDFKPISTKDQFEELENEGKYAFRITDGANVEYFSVSATGVYDAWNKAFFHPIMQGPNAAHLKLLTVEEVKELIKKTPKRLREENNNGYN